MNSLHRPLYGTTTKCEEDDDVGRKLLDVLKSRDRLLVRFASKSSTTNVVGSLDGSNKVHHQLSPLNDDDANDDDANDDKNNNDECEINALENEIITQLQTLNSVIRRRGLFNGDASRAARYYERAMERYSSSSSSSSVATTTATDDNETKRKRKKSGGGGGGGGNNGGSTGTMSASSYGIYLDSIHANTTSDGHGTAGGGDYSYDNNNNNNNHHSDLKEGLILTALCKILGVYVGRKKKKVDNDNNDNNNDDSMTDQSSSRSSRSISDNSKRAINNLSLMMTCAAMDVLCSLCDHAKDGRKIGSDVTPTPTEGDMISSIGPYLLDALVNNIQNFIFLLHQHNCITNKTSATTALHGLLGCFRACVSIITLLTVRLSCGTANKTIQTLRCTTWKVVTSLNLNRNNSFTDDNNDETTSSISMNVQHAAITLLATLPLTGVSSSDGGGASSSSPPNKIWSRCIIEGITLLNWAIDDFFPMMQGLDGNSNKTKSIVSTTLSTDDTERLKEDYKMWVNVAKEPPSRNNSRNNLDFGNDNTDNHRAYSFLHRIQCLTQYLHSLLLMECYPLPNRMNSTATNHLIVPIDALIDISEILLSFTLMAETRQYITKSRLRSTPIIGGLISPNLALVISPKIRVAGHELLNVLMESCRGGYGMLSKARRIVNIVCTNLHSSCSNVLVSVVDGSMRRGGSGGGRSNRMTTASSSSKAGSWLRGSIPLRIKSIHTFHVMVIALGSGVMSSTSTVKSISRALVLLGGCLLEQVQGMMDDDDNVVASSIMLNGIDDEWGTLGEKAKLVDVSSMALAAFIATFGGLIPSNVRGTIDSITHTCLTALYLRGNSSILAYSNVKRAILQLGMNCVCVPWGDGGRSTLSDVLQKVSTMLRRDPDVAVASAALSTLCAFDSFVTPRAPPILIPTRGGMMSETVNDGGGSGGSGLTASTLMQDINQAKLALATSKDAQDDKKVKKLVDKKLNKKAKKEDVEVVDTKASFESLKTAQFNSNSTQTLDACNGVTPVVAIASSESVTVINIATSSGVDSLHVTDANDIETTLPASSRVVIDDCQNERHNKMNDSQLGNESGVSKEEVYVPQNDKGEDDDSMDDFPEIVDEEPDEDDRIL